MKLLIVDAHMSLSSPSMKGIVRSLPALRAAGISTEAWCWKCDEDLPLDRVVTLPRFGNVHTFGAYAFSLWARLRAWWCYQVKKQPRPDVIYTVAWYLPWCDVAHVHFSPFDWERRQRKLGTASLRDAFERAVTLMGLPWARHFLRKTTAKKVLSVSQAVAEDIRAEAPHLDVQVLPNCYDASRFHPGVRDQWRAATRAQLGFAGDETVFIFVSTGHYRRKGFFLAVEAMHLLRQSHPGCRLLVVGGMEKRLQELQSRLDQSHAGWRDWITFTGMVPDVEKYFAASDGFLFPSYSEAFALVEVEAAACGLPLFLTRHHGSEMILDDGVNGRYMDFDAADMARVLGEFASGSWKPERMHLKQALDSDAYAARLVEILTHV